MRDEDFFVARQLFYKADEEKPQKLENLHDIGFCSMMLAREKFDDLNHAAALRELDTAIFYFEQGMTINPAHEPCIEGKNIALEMKGQFDEALKHAEWVSEYLGPAAKQHIYLAKELEERGDYEGALLRFRQAVAMEPKNPYPHIEFAEYLFRREKHTAAIAHLQIAYKLDPFNREVANILIENNALPQMKNKDYKSNKSSGKSDSPPSSGAVSDSK